MPAVDKASLKTLPKTYEHAAYIILLFKLDRSQAFWSHVNIGRDGWGQLSIK